MAENAKAVELYEGARIGIKSTIYEDPKSGRLFKADLDEDLGKRVKTRTVGGKKYLTKTLVFPFPPGLVEDPLTKRPATEMSPQELTLAIEHWLKTVAAVKAAGGHVMVKGKDGRAASFVIPHEIIPSIADLFKMGYLSMVQGPLKVTLMKRVLEKRASDKAPRVPQEVDLNDLG